MNKIFLVNLNTTLISLIITNSAHADSDILKAIVKTPLSATSMAAGTVAGTPIAIVRKTDEQYVRCVKLFKRDNNSYKFWGTTCSIPVAVGAGLIKGTIYSTKNAVYYSVNKPFDKNAFSLGPLKDNVSKKKKTGTSTNLKSGDTKPESQPWGS